MSTFKTDWEVWEDTDVWGNAEDGYSVNDRTCIHRHYELTLSRRIANPKTEYRFYYAYPTNKQIRDIFGIMGEFNLDGDDINIFVSTNDDYPIGVLCCLSHKSLSPICANPNYKW